MNDNNRMGSSFLSGLVGAIVGGAAVMLADEKMRNNLRKKINDLMGDIEDKKNEGKDKIEKEIKKTRNTIADKLRA